MCETTSQEIIAEIESALQKELAPFLYTALIPGAGLHFTDRALIEYYTSAAIESVLQKHIPQEASMSLQKIKDATTKENFGDAERNWLISECERLTGIVEKAASILSGKNWSPEAGTNRGRLGESNGESEETEYAEPS